MHQAAKHLLHGGVLDAGACGLWQLLLCAIELLKLVFGKHERCTVRAVGLRRKTRRRVDHAECLHASIQSADQYELKTACLIMHASRACAIHAQLGLQLQVLNPGTDMSNTVNALIYCNQLKKISKVN
jgi:hypothetical protein